MEAKHIAFCLLSQDDDQIVLQIIPALLHGIALSWICPTWAQPASRPMPEEHCRVGLHS